MTAKAKDRSKNPEVKHLDHLLTALEGGKVPDLEPQHVVPPKGAGSQNYWLPERAIDLVLGRRVKATERDFERAYQAACADQLPGGKAWGWMGTEAGSRSYGGLHGIGWLLAYVYGTPATRARAEVWLRFAVAMCAASAAPNGRVLLCGQRSAQRPQPVWWDGLLEAARGGDPGKWRRAGNWGQPNRKAWTIQDRTQAGDWAVLERFAAQVAGAADYIAGGQSLNPGAAFVHLEWSPFYVQAEYHWLHRHDGSLIACWTDRTINGNTAPMLAGIVNPGGAPSWLPVNGGKHVRGEDDGNDQATCILSGSQLYYTARVNDNATADLPSGPAIYRRLVAGKLTTSEVVL